MSARRRPGATVVVVGLLGVCVFLWQLRAAVAPATSPAPPASAAAVAAALGTAGAPLPAPAIAPSPAPAAPELPAPPETPELRGHDTVDPCTVGFEPVVPPGYDTVVADGVTVAWQPGVAARGPYDVAPSPTAVAYLANGLLAEAAALTGTPRRERITVIIYPSRAALRAAAGSPAWSDGVYDGGAVRLAALPTGELGVDIATVRHELIHAQLHAAVGCMPSWLNEGIAMYFAGAPPLRPWLRMLRNPDSFDLAALEVPSFVDLADERAERAYAESLAMIVFVVERAGELGLKAAVQSVRREGPRPGTSVWERLYPGAGHRAVLDALARKLFGAPLGSELDAQLRGAICCYGLRAISGLGCRGVAPRADRTRWIDATSSPRATCDTSW